MSCAMDYQQLVPPPVPVVPHQSHHHHNSQQQQQQQPALAAVPPTHPHIVLAPAHQPQQPPPNLPPPTTHAHQVHPPLPPIHDDSTSSRWTQYQHIWRQHHVYVNGEKDVEGIRGKDVNYWKFPGFQIKTVMWRNVIISRESLRKYSPRVKFLKSQSSIRNV
ncbi:hypothetical protein PV326_007557 [Microctonus aethiopoides]|nr:hypothetical protein PV326_007557 [Microctonus aethiopoides]